MHVAAALPGKAVPDIEKNIHSHSLTQHALDPLDITTCKVNQSYYHVLTTPTRKIM